MHGSVHKKNRNTVISIPGRIISIIRGTTRIEITCEISSRALNACHGTAYLRFSRPAHECSPSPLSSERVSQSRARLPVGLLERQESQSKPFIILLYINQSKNITAFRKMQEKNTANHSFGAKITPTLRPNRPIHDSYCRQSHAHLPCRPLQAPEHIYPAFPRNSSPLFRDSRQKPCRPRRKRP